MKNDMSPENNKREEKTEIKIGEITKTQFLQEVYVEIPPAKFEISEQRLENWLRKNIKKLENKRAWIPPLCLLLPLIFYLVTADFKNALGLNSELWQTSYILAIIAISIWLIISVFKLFNSISLNQMINNLKKDMHKFTYYRRFE